MKSKFLKHSLALLFTVVYTIPALADECEDLFGEPCDGGDGFEDAPIDNWIIFLALAGIIYGYYFFSTQKKAVK